MKKILLLSAIAFTFFACSKESSSGTRPILTFKSASMEDVPAEVKQLEFYFNLQDGDGDTEAELYFLDLYRMDTSTQDGNDPYDFLVMPALESHKGVKLNAELTLIMSDFEGPRIKLRANPTTPANKVDTSQMKVFIKDNAGNYSDTILLPKIIVRWP